MTAMRIWISATCRSKSRAMHRPAVAVYSDEREALAQDFNTMHPLADRVMRSMIPRGLVSTRFRRWYPLQFRQIALPRYFEARRASVLATAPAVTVFHGCAFCGGEVRPGIDPVDQFSPERAETRGMTACAPRPAMASWHLRVS